MNTARVKTAMKESGYKQGQLAEKIGIAPNTMSRYIRDNRSVPSPVLYDIAKALGVTMEYLMEDD